jgi:hypothetical protein
MTRCFEIRPQGIFFLRICRRKNHPGVRVFKNTGVLANWFKIKNMCHPRVPQLEFVGEKSSKTIFSPRKMVKQSVDLFGLFAWICMETLWAQLTIEKV